MSPAAAQRVFLTLTVLRWLPVGLLAPVMVLLPRARGVDLATIGALFAIHSVLITVLELPTGGLADAIGRRPVLLLSAAISLVAMVGFALAQSVLAFAVVYALKGVSRALDSGPLEAWYVDTARADDVRADISRGLSRAGTADGLALCLGAVVGGLLPMLVSGEALVVPVLAAIGCQALFVAIVAARMTEDRPGRGAGALRRSVRETPEVVRGAVRLAVREPGLRLILLLAAVAGVMLSTVEIMGPAFVARLTDDPEAGARIWGFAMAAAFGAAAVGSALAPRVRRLAGGSPEWAAAALSAGAALAMLALAGVETAVTAAACIVVMYLLGGARNPLVRELLHDRVGPRRRATALSAESLSLQGGGMAGGLALPALAAVAGFGVAWVVAAGVLSLATLLCALLTRVGAPDPAAV